MIVLNILNNGIYHVVQKKPHNIDKAAALHRLVPLTLWDLLTVK